MENSAGMVNFHTKSAQLKSKEVAGLTVDQLKSELKQRNQSATGKKADLAERLTRYLEEMEGQEHTNTTSAKSPAAAAAAAPATVIAGSGDKSSDKGKRSRSLTSQCWTDLID